jgi:hypothetical protein
MPSSAPAVKAALMSLLESLYDEPTLVCWGPPTTYQPSDIVSVGGQVVEFGAAPMAPTRPREEIVQTALTFSSFTADTQQVATLRAFEMYDVLADHFKTAPNETLGGACREAIVSGFEVEEFVTSPAVGSGVMGRTTAITATVTTRTRI